MHPSPCPKLLTVNTLKNVPGRFQSLQVFAHMKEYVKQTILHKKLNKNLSIPQLTYNKQTVNEIYVLIINFELTLHIVLVFPLLTLNN